MKKNIISVWRSARANAIGLPACPDDLTEPQYAELVFGQHCHVRALLAHRTFNLTNSSFVARPVTRIGWPFERASEPVLHAPSRNQSTVAFLAIFPLSDCCARLVYNAFTVWRAIPHQIDVLLPRIAIKAPQKRRSSSTFSVCDNSTDDPCRPRTKGTSEDHSRMGGVVYNGEGCNRVDRKQKDAGGG